MMQFTILQPIQCFLEEESEQPNNLELPQFSANDLTLLMDLKFSSDIPEDIMRLASEWGSAGLSDPNDVVYIVLEEAPMGGNRGPGEPKNFSIPVKYRCEQCFVEFDEMQQLECHVICHQIMSAEDAHCIEWASKIADSPPGLESNIMNKNASLTDAIQFEPTDLELFGLSNVNCETFQSILDNFNSEEQTSHEQKELEPPILDCNTREKSYECKHCGKTFSRGFLLREHLKDAVKQNPFICEQCGVCFSNRENLKNHLSVHSEETFYSCNDCGKTFRQRGYLKSHVRTHTGEKPFNCQVCGKSFTQKSNLNIHLKGHTGGKPHSCKYCGECFAYKMMLNSHLKSHI